MKRLKVILVGSFFLDDHSLEIIPVLLTEDTPLLPKYCFLGVAQNLLCKGNAVFHCRKNLHYTTPYSINSSLRNNEKAWAQCHCKRRYKYITTCRNPAMHHILWWPSLDKTHACNEDQQQPEWNNRTLKTQSKSQFTIACQLIFSLGEERID